MLRAVHGSFSSLYTLDPLLHTLSPFSLPVSVCAPPVFRPRHSRRWSRDDLAILRDRSKTPRSIYLLSSSLPSPPPPSPFSFCLFLYLSPSRSGQRLLALRTTFASMTRKVGSKSKVGRRTVRETGYHCYNVVATTSHGRLRMLEMPTLRA